MIVIQIIIYLLLFTVMVKIAVIGGPINGLYFYPKSVQKRALEIGLIEERVLNKKKCCFMIFFCIVMFAALLWIIGVWNHVNDFKTAYLQALLFLEIMNWYDGIIIDKIWVGYSKLWVIPELSDIPYVQTWKQILIKRSILTAVWIAGAAVVAGLI